MGKLRIDTLVLGAMATNCYLVINQETKKMIGELYGSFDHWLQQKIEASVNAAKKQ